MARNIYEIHGRYVEAAEGRLERLQGYFQETQQLLSQLAAGEVSPAQLTVTGTGWSLEDPPPEEEPEEGLPPEGAPGQSPGD